MAVRPPKPENRERSPRFQERKAKRRMTDQSGKEAALKKVRNLIGADITPEHAAEFLKQVHRVSDDRGAAILTATNTENILRYAILRRLAVGLDDTDKLFGMNGPMRTFDQKIRMGVALKIFGPETESNLTLIRTIRNAFAHSTIPIKFRTPEIATLCKFLVMPFVLYPKSIKIVDGKVVDVKEPKQPRKRFIAVCEATAHNLFIDAGHCSQRPRSHSDFGRYEVWLKLPPLP